MYSENMADTIEYICRSGIDVTVDKIISRAGLDWGEVPEMTIARMESDMLANNPNAKHYKNFKEFMSEMEEENV